jgi:hypothetical protein
MGFSDFVVCSVSLHGAVGILEFVWHTLRRVGEPSVLLTKRLEIASRYNLVLRRVSPAIPKRILVAESHEQLYSPVVVVRALPHPYSRGVVGMRPFIGDVRVPKLMVRSAKQLSGFKDHFNDVLVIMSFCGPNGVRIQIKYIHMIIISHGTTQ